MKVKESSLCAPGGKLSAKRHVPNLTIKGVHKHSLSVCCRSWRRLLHAAVLFVFALSSTGCVAAKYKMADESIRPPIELNLAARSHSAEATLKSLIIYGGAGSWKHEAYWDEYVVAIKNLGVNPLTAEAAMLADMADRGVFPGNNPWELQDMSKTVIKNYRSGTSEVALKVGAATLMTGTAGAALTGGIVCADVAMIGGAAVAVVALPVIVFGTIGVNVRSKHMIEEEFQRRRMVLPAVIQPGETVQGSLFFPITPAPQQLSLFFIEDGPLDEIRLNLADFSTLHLENVRYPVTP